MSNNKKTKKTGAIPSYLAGDTGQGTTPLRVAIDVPALTKWISQQTVLISLLVEEAGFDQSDVTNAHRLAKLITISQFGFGQSNPTFLLSLKKSKSTSPIKWVLRKKPPQIAHASAHALHREFKVLRGVQRHNDAVSPQQQVPVPRVYGYCTDTSVLGAEFYVMQFLQGRIFTDPSLPTLTNPAERRAAFEDVIRVLANLHAIDLPSVGLADYGKPGRYVERQLSRLLSVSRKQAQLAGDSENNPAIEFVATQLQRYASQCPNPTGLLQ